MTCTTIAWSLRSPTLALAIFVVLGSVCQIVAIAQENGQSDLRKQPITADQGPVGKLLRKWWDEGAASGNVGDFYDNRDGGHSDLRTEPYPQLQRIHYTPEDIKKRRHCPPAFLSGRVRSSRRRESRRLP